MAAGKARAAAKTPAAARTPAGPNQAGSRPVPAVGKHRPARLPRVAEHTLDNGLRVLVARRPGIPRFECRLQVPTARGDAVDPARMRVLTETILGGTSDRSSRQIAEALQSMGAGLGADVDADQLVLGGSSLSSYRSRFVHLMGEVLLGAVYPVDEVAIERERVVTEIALQRSQPGVIASDALVRRLYGTHPYGRGTPDPAAVAKVQPAVLRRLHAARIDPGGSVLVMVGDLDLDATLADVTDAFGGWVAGAGGRAAGRGLAPPVVSTPPSMLLVDRPGAVQTNVRMGGRSIPRTDPQYPAVALAVMVFGGYFTSRLNDNIREQKGYTYGSQARIDHRRAVSTLGIAADVGREATAPALVEIAYELGRMVSLPVTQAELDAARRYLQGTMAMGIQTQSGLTSYLTMLASVGLPVTYLRDFPEALEHVTPAEVLEAARVHLRPGDLTTVLVGDAATVGPAVAPLGPVEASR